jgi:hypothetical protein
MQQKTQSNFTLYFGAMLCYAMLCHVQALSLLEHLVKSGTERVVEDARDHLHRYILALM